MKNSLRKIAIVTIALATMSAAANAQTGEKTVGVYLALAAGEAITNIGIGGKFQYNVSDPIRLEGSMSYFLPRKSTKTSMYLDFWTGGVYTQLLETTVSMWDLSANAHYLFIASDEYTVYPLLGLSILGATVKVYDEKRTETSVGLNLGGGMDFEISENVIINGELMYRIGAWSRFIVGAGIVFKF